MSIRLYIMQLGTEKLDTLQDSSNFNKFLAMELKYEIEEKTKEIKRLEEMLIEIEENKGGQ